MDTKNSKKAPNRKKRAFLIRRGKKASSEHFKISTSGNIATTPEVTIIIKSKNIRSAVSRNFQKRRIRYILGKHKKNLVNKVDYSVELKMIPNRKLFTEVENELLSLLKNSGIYEKNHN